MRVVTTITVAIGYADNFHGNSPVSVCPSVPFYCAMHYSAQRGLAIACRLSVCPSVCPYVASVDHDHIG